MLFGIATTQHQGQFYERFFIKIQIRWKFRFHIAIEFRAWQASIDVMSCAKYATIALLEFEENDIFYRIQIVSETLSKMSMSSAIFPPF